MPLLGAPASRRPRLADTPEKANREIGGPREEKGKR